ncbi:MAG: sigma-70 family RNA polymerase sigma factor [Planctomycetota bacterium]|nr:sigma-70 family RNA polymerase sigma factor [Planctomycetota bacterium]
MSTAPVNSDEAERSSSRMASGGSPAGAATAEATGQRLLAEHGDALWRFCLARSGSRDQAEDIVQETLLAALSGAHAFAGRSSERTWLLGIASHKLTDALRRAARDRAGTVQDAVDNSGGSSPTEPGLPRAKGEAGLGAGAGLPFDASGRWTTTLDPGALSAEGHADRTDLLRRLRSCMEELTPGQAEVVWMRDLLGVPGGEVCEALGLTPTTLWTRLHRARLALRLCLTRGGIGAEEKAGCEKSRAGRGWSTATEIKGKPVRGGAGRGKELGS